MMKNKRITTPDFYNNFVCAAGNCPDTCCKDWDIVVDDDTYEFYSSVGDEVFSKIITDSDGDRVICFENGVCPFLDESKLCALQVKYGERGLCSTCSAFPRITQDYTEFEERLLTLACPEAARAMIVEENTFDFIEDTRVKGCGEYDEQLMNFLLRARFITAEIFRADKPFAEKMRSALAFSEHTQQLLDDDDFDIDSLSAWREFEYSHDITDISAVFEIHSQLDVMDRLWLEEAVNCKDVKKLPDTIDGELSRLALYYIARYYLTAISSYDIITTVKRIYCAALVCAALIAKNGAENDSIARALIYQKYSKEIEHSDENTDYLTDIFLDERFESCRLIFPGGE